MKRFSRVVFCVVLGFGACSAAGDESLVTVAEQSDFTATSRYDDVVRFCQTLADRSPLVAMKPIGTTIEGREIPMLIVADPPLTSANEVKRPERLVVGAMANIHAGEVCGKEALLMLARDIALAKERPLLKDLVLLFIPIYNADGNERISTENRPKQNGPEKGTGIRANAQGLDLNRDHVKLESPEAKALVGVLRRWDPAMFIDCHTTNGSYHRCTLTYDGPRHPAIDGGLLDFSRNVFLPEVGKRVKKAAGYDLFFYGNFNAAHDAWMTYPALPRYNTQYVGFRNRLGVLSEAHAYASYQDRVLATHEFVRQCLAVCVDRKQTLIELLDTAESASRQAADSETTRAIALVTEPEVLGTFTVGGYVEEDRGGEHVRTDIPKDYEVEYYGKERATVSVTRPAAYLIPEGNEAAIDNLLAHGVDVRLLREDLVLNVEVYRLDEVQHAENAYQGHHLAEAMVTSRKATRNVPAGTFVVRTDQSLGTFACMLLEPRSPDGLVAWNFFDEGLVAGKDFPVMRLPDPVPMLTVEARSSADLSKAKKPVTFETLYGESPVSFSGHPASGFQWMEDGEHFLQKKDGRCYKVHAASGRSEPLYDVDAIATAFEELEEIEKEDAETLAQRAWRKLDSARTAGLLTHQDDLYYVSFMGNDVRRLTCTPEAEELASFSPDGKRIAFVRENDLYVMELATGAERRLTQDGTDTHRNGKADWVYFEEIYDRNWNAYKWAPDSQSIAFQQFDGAAVGEFLVLDQVKPEQRVEVTRYPLAGSPNPTVRLGCVSVKSGSTQWIDLSRYADQDVLVSHFGWTPDSAAIYCYVQDRAQHWLDWNRATLEDGKTSMLFREASETWVDNPGDSDFLEDGSFLWLSERDGWKHLYHYAKEGQLLRRVTQGPWEVRDVGPINEAEGWIYFEGTRDSHLGGNLYRVELDGTDLVRLTSLDGAHETSANATGSLFIDTHSDAKNPARVRLYRGDGVFVRKLDINPVFALREYRLLPLEMFEIPTRDGAVLEASLIKPPDFDPKKKYPVWLQTYGGPHAPSLSNSWRGGRTFERLIAEMGILAFRCDPRSASGKGANSTRIAYRQLGVPELQDIEDALDWLAKQPFAEMSRVGLSGHSYGGFMTAYAMTHCDRFAAGIAGAPVTDWRNYDTIYTERYMDTPDENPEGYDKTSVVQAAKNLHGRLLLIHGARDDNVHIANTMQLVHELQQADRPFELMVYPASRHGIHGKHYHRVMVDFIRRTMLE